VGGYRWDVWAVGTAASLSTSNQDCVVVTISLKPSPGSGVRNLSGYSWGAVDANTVILNAGGPSAPGNLSDATANLSSNTFANHAGTAGHDTGPGLEGLVGGASGVDLTDNALFLQFDQQLASSAAALAASCGRVAFYDANGGIHKGIIIGVTSSGQAEAVFGSQAVSDGCNLADAGANVGMAVRVVVFRTPTAGLVAGNIGYEGEPVNQGNPTTGGPTGGPSCISEQGGDAQTCAPTVAIPVPGTGGQTNRPDLVSATLNQNSDTVDATFSVPVQAKAASDAVVTMSDGEELQATGNPVVIGSAPVTINGTTTSETDNVVRFTFAPGAVTLQQFDEMAVFFNVYGSGGVGSEDTNCLEGAVADLNSPNLCNTTGGVPIGDNAGAFDTGYSTGPDPTYLIVNPTTGQIAIGFDQRINPASVVPADISLYDKNTTLISNLTGLAVTVTNPTPFTSELDVTDTPTSVQRIANGGAVAISGDPFGAAAAFTYAAGTFTAQGTVDTVISPNGVAGKLTRMRGFHVANKRQLRKDLKKLHFKHKRSHKK
jgi:hypothetical protein